MIELVPLSFLLENLGLGFFELKEVPDDAPFNLPFFKPILICSPITTKYVNRDETLPTIFHNIDLVEYS